MLSLHEGPLWSPNHPLECQMSKRKPATASKHAPSPKIAAQRANQAIIRSPKDNRLRSVAAGSTEFPPRRHKHSKKGFYFSSATENVRAYQAKLLEMAQANMQLAFEFAQRLGTFRSPVEILSVIAEFTNKRITMFQKYSVEMAELSTSR